MASEATLEWFGATTFRLRACGLTIFLDAWIERPANVTSYLKIEDVDECDYILISHAHFDHLPGADRLARRTGATIVGNGEAINVMRNAGVPETQLAAVSGGERVPLFTAAQRKQASGSPTPDTATPAATVHIWPSLHCLMPVDDISAISDHLDTGTVYTGSKSYSCSMDITRALTHVLGSLIKTDTFPPGMPDDMKTFLSYVKDRDNNKYSFFDGGQLMYNILLGDKTLLWHGHLGAYEGIIKALEPRPDVAILAVAGRANLNGRPFDGSAAEFARKEVEWIGEPEKVIWCLHDQAPLKPYYIDTKAATELVSRTTKSRVVDLKHAEVFRLFG